MHSYSFQVSPNHKLLTYGEDIKGDEIYTVYTLDIETGKSIGIPLTEVTEYVEWIDDETLIYITQDDLHRPFKACGVFFLELCSF